MTVAEINRRIKSKLNELADDHDERQRAHRIISRKETRIEELRVELTRTRKRIKRRRAAIAEVKADLEELEAATPDEDTEEEARLRAQLDELAGQLEEATHDRDRILGRLDRLKEKRDEARQMLSNAIAESDEDRKALARLRARRERIRAAQDRPSPHFDWAEFDCNDGTRLPEQSKPAVKDWCQKVGEPVRERFGSVIINSAFRHRAYNESIGGEDNSVHIYEFPGRDFKAVAVDFRCSQGTPADWFAFTSGRADGRGRYATFVHADTRNRIGWPDATWTG